MVKVSETGVPGLDHQALAVISALIVVRQNLTALLLGREDQTNLSDRGRWSVSAGCNPVASGLVGSNPTSLTKNLRSLVLI